MDTQKINVVLKSVENIHRLHSGKIWCSKHHLLLSTQVLYAIESGNSDSRFGLDPYTGRLTTTSSLAYAADLYTLLITATDQGYPALTATLTLTLLVNPPTSAPPAEVTWRISEGSVLGTEAGALDSATFVTGNRSVVGYNITSGNYG
jgi:protocadherin Fat 4